MSSLERRQALLEVLCERRYDKVENLAFEFSVSNKTIYRDLIALSLSYPIYTQCGNGGGVYVADDYYLNKQYLKTDQLKLLKKLEGTLSGKDKETLHSIIENFSRPNKKGS